MLPGTGRDKAFRLSKAAEGADYAVEAGADGDVVGYLALFDETLVAAAQAVECLVRSPESLANLLEAAGGLALERAGVILDARVGPERSPAAAATA